MERVPATQTILVSHHDGGVLPINGVCFDVSWHEHYAFARPLYVLTHDVLHEISTGFSKILAQLGVIRADRRSLGLSHENGGERSATICRTGV